MIFIFNAKGECLASTPSEVNQGNLGVNDVIIIAPFPSTAVITAAVQLPDKRLISPQYVEGEGGITPDADDDLKLTLLESFSEKLGLLGTPVNVWKLTLKRVLTHLAGDLKLSFSVFSDGAILETDTVTLAVTRTVPTLSPTVTADDLDGIAQLLAAMNVVYEETKEILADAEGEFAKKLNRIEPTDEQIEADQYWVYAIRDRVGAGMIQCESGRKANTIVYRGSDGYFKVYDPTEERHPTSKKYVDDADEELKRYVDLTCEDVVTRVSWIYDANNYTVSLVYNTVLPDGSTSRRLLGPVIDLPLESVVLNATYDDATKSIVLNLVNSNTTSIPVGELISGLLPIDLERTNSTYPYGAYTIDSDGVPHTTPVSNNPNPRYIPVYNSARRLKTETPTEDNDCANKKYVDDAVVNAGSSSQKLYRHDICLGSDAWATGNMIEVCISFVNTDPTSYEKFADFDVDSGDMITPFTADDFSFLPSDRIMATGYVADGSGSDSSIVFCCSNTSSGVVFCGVYLDDYYYSETMPFKEFEYIYDTVTEVM